MTTLTKNERLQLQEVFSSISDAKPSNPSVFSKLIMFIQAHCFSPMKKQNKFSLKHGKHVL